jgi:hypothetical protein
MTKEEILLEVLNEHGDFENVSSQFNENDLACILEAMKRYKGQSLPIDSVVGQSEQLNRKKRITLPKVEPSKVWKSNEGVN